MWRSEEEISADLSSGDPQRFAEAVRDLEDQMRIGDEISLSPPDLSDLSAFGEALPPATRYGLLNLVTNYRSFDPPLTPEQIHSAYVDLLHAASDDALPLELALTLRLAPSVRDAVTGTLAEVARRGVKTPEALTATQRLLSYLIAGDDPARIATLEAVKDWHADPGLKPAIQFIEPELEPAEQALVHGA